MDFKFFDFLIIEGEVIRIKLMMFFLLQPNRHEKI